MSAAITINDLQHGYQGPAARALEIARQQGRPAYVVLGPLGQVRADFPGVWCHRVNPDGSIDCCVIVA